MDDAQKHDTDEETTFTKTTDIADPVENVVHLPVDDLKALINFESHSNMDIIIKLIRAVLILIELENGVGSSELACIVHTVVGEIEFGLFQHIDDFFPELTVDRDPSSP